MIAETKKYETLQKEAEINEIHNSNAKKIKRLNSELKDKSELLDQANDRANDMSNKLNDVQAAAYMKDQKIKKMNLVE